MLSRILQATIRRGYETLQISKATTKVLQFMLEGPLSCTIVLRSQTFSCIVIYLAQSRIKTLFK